MMEALEIDAASGSSSTLPQLAGSSSKQQQRFNGNGNGNYAYASHDDDRGPNPPPLLPLESWHSSHDDDILLPAYGSTYGGTTSQRRSNSFYQQQQLQRGALLVAAKPEAKGGTMMQQRRAVITTIWSFVATAAFALLVVLPYKGAQATLDFTTGFLVEKSLSVDNLFVFLMLFEYFKVPDAYTERVLKWGIMSALVLRGVMIWIGVAAVQRFRPVLLAFSLILVVSAYKMLQPEAEADDLQDNAVMKIARWLVSAQDEYDEDKFFTLKGGKRVATPMLVVLICIELSDVLFAVDSIPAVVGITHDPFIVYSSNIFALMALRSLYQILSKSVQQLHYLRHAVATILGFVGVKMALEFFHYGISSFASLAVICGLLAAGTIASIAKNRSDAKLANGGGGGGGGGSDYAAQALHDVV